MLICVRKNFDWFEGEIIQGWLEKHGPFDAVIDGANVGLVNERQFNFIQVICIFNKFIDNKFLGEIIFSMFVH